MTSSPPTLVAINHDDYHAKHVGRTAEGRQFFLTTPFDPAIGGRQGGEFIARYLFDSAGNLIDATIDDLGPRSSMDCERSGVLYEQRLKELGQVTFGRIEIKPFSLEHSGITFGLVLREPEDADDVWAVELQPGNFMAFFAPWDSGDYDT